MGNEPTGGGPSDEPIVFGPDTVISPDSGVTTASGASTLPPEPTVPTAPIPPIMPQPVQPEVPAHFMPAAPEQAAPTHQPVMSPALDQPQPAEDDENYSDSYGADTPAITWSASEFIAHSKTSSWYAMVAVAAVALAGLIWLFTRDLFPTTAVAIGVMLLVVYAGRQPRQETYSLDDTGLSIGNRHFPFSEFRAFSIVPEGAFASVELVPLKRFGMLTTVYLDPDNEDAIVDLLSQYLPVQEAKANLADSLMRRIHF